MPHHRFQGYTGKIEGTQGEAYLVGITVGKKHKTLIVKSEHLGRVK
jgi:large subunit ribosomal protein L21e